MAAYVIYQGEVTDPERYERYRAAAAESIATAGGRYLARGGGVVTLAGAPPSSRVVLVEFPTLEAAVAWYEGESYRAARALREGAASAAMFVVEGVD